MPLPTARDRFFTFLKKTLYEGIFEELVLGKYQGADRRMRSLCVRQIGHIPGKQVLTFTYVHVSHETETPFPLHEALAELEKTLGTVFLDAHLVTTAETYHLTFNPKGNSLKITPSAKTPTPASVDEEPAPAPTISTSSPWCRALDSAMKRENVREGEILSAHQINELIGWLGPLIEYTGLPGKKKTASSPERPFTIVQMNAGRGHLAFAIASFFGSRIHVRGVDSRPELVDLCNCVAVVEKIHNLTFTSGALGGATPGGCDVLIALSARDTAADDALAGGIAANASLVVVAPSEHKELRRQLSAPMVWHDVLKQEALVARQASSITDAFRALLLAWAGYKIKTIELTTAANNTDNLLLAAIKPRIRVTDVSTDTVRAFARFYGIRKQRLAERLGLTL